MNTRARTASRRKSSDLGKGQGDHIRLYTTSPPPRFDAFGRRLELCRGTEKAKAKHKAMFLRSTENGVSQTSSSCLLTKFTISCSFYLPCVLWNPRRRQRRQRRQGQPDGSQLTCLASSGKPAALRALTGPPSCLRGVRRVSKAAAVAPTATWALLQHA